MGDLRDCYFCGTFEEPLEPHPLIPPASDPPEEAQRTVTVCRTCGAKLERVLEPVVAYYGGEAAPSGSRVGTSPVDSDAAQGEDQRDTSVGGADPPNTSPGPEVSDSGDDIDRRNSSASADLGSGDSDRDVSVELPPEATDVTRLLQNRSFPVDREEIVTVAASAYEIEPGTCEAVLDGLIVKGRLREEDGKLYRPG